MCMSSGRDPFDYVGFVLSGLAIAGLAFGLSAMGLDFLPTGVVAALLAVGALSAVAYVIHAKRTPAPILDLSLLKLPTFRASIYRRLSVPARHRRAAVPAAAVAADRLRPDPVSVRPHHFYHRARLDVHEGRGRQRAQPLRLSQRAALQRADLERLSRRLRHFRARHALCRHDRDPACPAAFSARCNSPASTPSLMPRSIRRR